MAIRISAFRNNFQQLTNMISTEFKIDPESFIRILEHPERIFNDEVYKSIRIRSKIRLRDVDMKKIGEDLKLPFNLHFHLS